MNKISNKFLLTGDEFMPELHLKQTGLRYSSYSAVTIHRGRIQRYSNLKNELGKSCFVHDAEFSDSKDLAKTTISDQILKFYLLKSYQQQFAYEIAIYRNYDGY